MRHITGIMLVFLLAMGNGLFAQDQAVNFSGTWILNLEKSKLEHMGDGFTGSIFIINQEGDKLHLTRYHLFGEKKNKISFTMHADGETRKVKLIFRGKLEKTGAGLRATLWRKNFHNVVEYSFGSSRDEFIADEVFKGLPQDHHNVWVFDRKLAGKPE